MATHIPPSYFAFTQPALFYFQTPMSFSIFRFLDTKKHAAFRAASYHPHRGHDPSLFHHLVPLVPLLQGGHLLRDHPRLLRGLCPVLVLHPSAHLPWRRHPIPTVKDDGDREAPAAIPTQLLLLQPIGRYVSAQDEVGDPAVCCHQAHRGAGLVRAALL